MVKETVLEWAEVERNSFRAGERGGSVRLRIMGIMAQ